MMNFAQTGVMMGFTQSSSTLDASVQSWLAQIASDGGTTPSATVQTALSDFVTTLKSNGLWDRMKTGYIFHSGDTTVGRVNLKSPSTYKNTIAGTLQFSESNGTRSNGTTGYFDQPFKSDEYSGIQSDLTAIQYVSQSNTTGATLSSHGFRTTSGANYFRLIPYNGTRVSWYPFTSAQNGELTGNHKGLLIHTYDGSNYVCYKDGNKTSIAGAVAAPGISVNRYILALNNATSGSAPLQFYTSYVAVDFLFDRFNDTDESNFRTAFNTYKTAVSLP